MKAIIDLWPSRAALAHDLGIENVGTVQKWADRDRIPVEHWAGLIAAAHKRGHIHITAELLSRMASKG